MVSRDVTSWRLLVVTSECEDVDVPVEGCETGEENEEKGGEAFTDDGPPEVNGADLLLQGGLLVDDSSVGPAPGRLEEVRLHDGVRTRTISHRDGSGS